MIKALRFKDKKYKLCKKALLKETIILIFSFKIYSFIPKDKRDEYINQIENNFKYKRGFEKLIIYFKKNWAKTKFLDFQYIDNKTTIERTNNTCKVFHRNLINIINSYHPKILFYVDKIKEYTIKAFENSVKNMALPNDIKKEKISFYQNIFKFKKKIYKK